MPCYEPLRIPRAEPRAFSPSLARAGASWHANSPLRLMLRACYDAVQNNGQIGVSSDFMWRLNW
jgi:hypothetical protein